MNKIIKEDFTSIDLSEPPRNMVVEWICEDGVTDVGIFSNGQFYTLDPKSESAITHWREFFLSEIKPFTKQLQNDYGCLF